MYYFINFPWRGGGGQKRLEFDEGFLGNQDVHIAVFCQALVYRRHMRGVSFLISFQF